MSEASDILEFLRARFTRLDNVHRRLDRIERRLDLVDGMAAPTP